MPRALVLCEFPTLNGGERSLLTVLPTLLAAGWTIDVCCPATGPLAEALAALGVTVIPRPEGGANRRSKAEKLAERLNTLFEKAILDESRYDLVHANSLAMSIVAADLAINHRVPTIGHLRDIARLSSSKVALLNFNTRLLAVSQAVKTYHVAQGLAAERTHVLYNGVDLDTFRPKSCRNEPSGIRREFGISDGAPLIGVVGQIILRKGQEVGLTAAAEVLRHRPDAHVVVVGTRHSEKPETIEFEWNLHAITSAAHVADRVHFAGTREDMPALFREFAVLLHTARQEPLGRVLLEAAASGVPVVATEVGGTREIFPAAEADGALLVPVDNVAAAQVALESILGDPDRGHRMGAAGRARIEAAFTAERSAAGLVRHYREVAALAAR